MIFDIQSFSHIDPNLSNTFVLYIFIPENLVFWVFVVLVGSILYADSQFGFILARFGLSI